MPASRDFPVPVRPNRRDVPPAVAGPGQAILRAGTAAVVVLPLAGCSTQASLSVAAAPASESAAATPAAKAAADKAAAEAAAKAAAPPAPAAQPVPGTNPGCDPNYSGCVPIASDVDCAGGSGNGPAYVRGPVQVIGRDIYDLDADHDGVGCER